MADRERYGEAEVMYRKLRRQQHNVNQKEIRKQTYHQAVNKLLDLQRRAKKGAANIEKQLNKLVSEGDAGQQESIAASHRSDQAGGGSSNQITNIASFVNKNRATKVSKQEEIMTQIRAEREKLADGKVDKVQLIRSYKKQNQASLVLDDIDEAMAEVDNFKKSMNARRKLQRE